MGDGTTPLRWNSATRTRTWTLGLDRRAVGSGRILFPTSPYLLSAPSLLFLPGSQHPLHPPLSLPSVIPSEAPPLLSGGMARPCRSALPTSGPKLPITVSPASGPRTPTGITGSRTLFDLQDLPPILVCLPHSFLPPPLPSRYRPDNPPSVWSLTLSIFRSTSLSGKLS